MPTQNQIIFYYDMSLDGGGYISFTAGNWFAKSDFITKIYTYSRWLLLFVTLCVVPLMLFAFHIGLLIFFLFIMLQCICLLMFFKHLAVLKDHALFIGQLTTILPHLDIDEKNGLIDEVDNVLSQYSFGDLLYLFGDGYIRYLELKKASGESYNGPEI